MPRPSLVLLLGQCYAEQVGAPSHFGLAALIAEMTVDDGLATDAHDYFDTLGADSDLLNRDFVSKVHHQVLATATAAVPRPAPKPQDSQP